MQPIKNSIGAALWICGSVATSCLAQNLLPNPNFEGGQDQPTGWRLVGTTGRRLANAHETHSALVVQGNGKTQTYWRTDPVAFKPNALYRLSFFGRYERSNAEGAAITGLNLVNRDFRMTDSWVRYSFVFSVPGEDPKDYVRLGEWHLNGGVYFSEPELAQVVAKGKQIGANMELGEAESIREGVYRFKPAYNWTGANYHRPLVVNRANFNTDRLLFFPGSEIVYRLGLSGNPQTRAKLAVVLNYHVGGSLHVEAGRDRTNWLPVATCDGQRRDASTDLPSQLFPSDEIFVRLSSRGTNANLQVNKFEYESRLTKPAPDAEGATSFAEAEQRRPAL